MFKYSLSTVERIWLRALRIVAGASSNSDEAIHRSNQVLAAEGAGPAGRAVQELLKALAAAGASHLYLEGPDRPGITGDERDLLAALRACYLDDPLAAEYALSALLPPGEAEAVLPLVERVAQTAAPVSRCLSALRPGRRQSMAMGN